jgi:hypothetical protein
LGVDFTSGARRGRPDEEEVDLDGEDADPAGKHHLQHLTNTRRGLKKMVASLEY